MTGVQTCALPISSDVVWKALTIIMISLALVVASTILVSGFEQAPFMDVAFEVMSAFGTVGLSRGITASLSSASKVVIIGTMFAGRVGPLSLALALSRPKGNGKARYSEERVTVG